MKKILLLLLLTGSMVLNYANGATYTSSGSGDFYDINTWSPALTLTDLRSGMHDFIISNGHTVVLDDSLNVNNLNVIGVLTFGDGLGSHSLVVNGNLNITGTANVSASSGSHKLFVRGGFVSNGAVALRNNSNQVVNTYLNGTFSISGTNLPIFNNLNIEGGAITAARTLDINGNLLVGAGATFNAGTYTHNLAGSLSNSGTFVPNSGKFIFDGTLVQSVTSNVDLYDVDMIGGGIISLSGRLTVKNDINITNATKVVTSNNQYFEGEFSIDATSEFKANDGNVYFRGVTAQTITLAGNVIFDELRFEGSGTTKTIVGSLNCNNDMYIYDGVTVTDGPEGQIHYPEGIWIEGTAVADFRGTLHFDKANGHYIQKSTGDESVSLGPAEIIVDGALYIGTSGNKTTLNVSNDVTINTRHIVINDSSQLVSVGSELTVKENAYLYIRGDNNFPTGFGTVDLEDRSWVRYDANKDQVIRGGLDYGYLYTYQHTKTVDGSLNVKNNLYVYATEADSAVLDLGSFDHYLQGNFYDNYDVNRPNRKSYVQTSGGTFYLNGESQNQALYFRTNETKAYTFNNFEISNPNPTIVKTVSFIGYDMNNFVNTQTNMIVTGDFTATNSTTNASLPLELDFNTFVFSTYTDGRNGNNGTPSGTLTIGDNVKVFTTGQQTLQLAMVTFATRSFNVNSTVRFDGPEAQVMPSMVYGNVEFSGAGDKSPSFGSITVQGSIRRVGGSPVFRVQAFFGTVTHNFKGDWFLNNNEVVYTGTGTITMNFSGDNQQIRYATTFPNIIFSGSGIKTINGNLDVNGDFTIQNSIVVNASNYNIMLSGNFNNNTSGKFIHTNALLTLDGTANQTIAIQATNATVFESLTINKASGQVEALSDFAVSRNLYFTKNKGDFDVNANTIRVGGNFYTQEGAELIWDDGAMLHFNGSSEDQLIRNYNGTTVFPNMKFSGSGMKRLYEKTFDINGDFIMENAAVRAEWFDIYVSGNWINNGGSYGHYRATIFDGVDQYIAATDFEDVVFAGTGTKYLNGHINVGGFLSIEGNATLDVSPDAGVTSYNIAIEEHWNNNLYNVDSTSTGVFVPRKGTVTFVGEWSNIYTGDDIDAAGNGIVGKSFYNLVINNATINYYTRLYPVEDVDDVNVKVSNDLKVENNFILNNGLFYSYWNHVHVGGDFKNISGNLNLNEHRGQAPVVYLEGIGIHEFDPGLTHTIRRVEITKGGVYNLLDDLTMVGNNRTTELLVTDGKLDLNHNLLKINSNTGDITIGSNGQLEVDSLAQIQMYSGRSIYNSGDFRLVGTKNGPAILSTISGYFTFIQDAGIFHANYFSIENTGGDGVTFDGGTVDGINNFSNGRFSGGTGNAYVTVATLPIIHVFTINDLVFNEGPTYNVSRDEFNTGTEIVTLENSSGSLSGEAFDDDDGNRVVWTYPDSKFWDGEGADGLWHTAANWVGDVVPVITDNVILDHTHVAAAYTVTIESDAEAARISVGSGVNAIGLSLDGGNFIVDGNITINNSGTLAQIAATDTLFVAGSFSNSGTFNANSSVVVFNPTAGAHSISNAQPFNDLKIAGAGGEIVLGSNIDVNGNVTVDAGVFGGSNKTLSLSGNWFVGGGTFDGGAGTVLFDRNDATSQTISGGRFYNVTVSNSSPKVLNDLIFLDGTMTIKAGAFLNGGEQYIFIGDHWYNEEGSSGFSQTGNGTVVFNGAGTSYIGDYSPPSITESTTFNHLTFDGTGTKYIANSITVNGNLTNRTGSNVYIGSAGYTATEITGTGLGSFTMNGGTMYLLGVNSFPQGFGEYSLTGGTVDYYSDDNQIIYGSADLEYHNLRIRRVNNYLDPGINGGGYTTKTANGNLFVSNQIWANDTCTILDMGGRDLYLEGSLQLATQVNGYPPQIVWGGGSLIHEGGNISLDPDVILYNKIIKRGNSRLYLSVDVTVTGNISISDDCSMDMRTFKMECTAAGKTFSLGANSVLVSSVADTVTTPTPITTYAFPTGFTNYNVESTNTYYLNGDQNQAILPNVTYGTIYLNQDVTKTVTLHGDLDVNNDFRINADGIVLDDQGFDLYLAGYYNDLRNYNPTSTITFDGEAEQRIYAGGSFDVVHLNNVVFNGGGGTTYLYEPNYNITGDFSIAVNDTVYSNQNINFSGGSFINLGVFNHANNRFIFNGIDQTIDPGVNDFYNVQFNNSGTKTFVNTGVNINNDMLIQGVFVAGDPSYYEQVVVDFGALTHYIGSTSVIVNSNSSWLTADANIYFDRPGTQNIPAISLNNIFLANRGYKYLTGSLNANDITIESGVNFRSSEDQNSPYDIYCTGSWTNDGTYVSWTNTVYFDAADTDDKEIKTNNDAFHRVLFNQNDMTERIYMMQDNFQINEELIVGNGATLKVNGNNLQLGNNDTNDGSYPDGEEHIIEFGGTIDVDAGGGMLFDQNDMYPKLTVFGTLKVVGTSGSNATFTQLAGGTRRGTEVIIENGAEVHFRFYTAEYLHYDGLVVKDGATIDPTNNFSDGIWNGIYDYASYTELNDAGITRDRFIYLNLQNDVSGIGTINNVTFNHPRTPTVGSHYNVYRPLGTTGTVTFAGTSGGAMAGETFELDEDQVANGAPGLIVWPPVTQLTWDGSASSDWFTAQNWTPTSTPTSLTDVVIPLITDGGDNPIITASNAECKDLNITDGILAIENGVTDFRVAGNFVMQSDAIFAVSDQTVISVTGDWDVSSDAVFAAGESKVDFVSSVGSTVINSRNAAFYDLRFSGGATFYVLGTSLYIENDILIDNGTIIPSNSNYNYYIGGNYNKTGGSFSISPDVGFFDFNGSAEQHISGGRFSRLRISNQSSTVFIDDSTSVVYPNNNVENPAFEVTAGAVFEATDVLYIDGNVAIEKDGTFNDGGLAHIFEGRNWFGEGNYVGTGTIRFTGSSQYFYRSSFYNLALENTREGTNSWKYLYDTVNVSNNVNMDCYGFLLYEEHVINPTGNGVFAIGDAPNDARVYVRGEDNYPSGFSSYTSVPNSYIIYDAFFDQTVRGEVDGADVQYGRLYLRNGSNKTLEGDIDIENILNLDVGAVVFDANDYNINLAGNWYNQNDGTFLPGSGEVIFDGPVNQMVYLRSNGTNDFNKIIVDKDDPLTAARIVYNDIVITDKLWARSGIFYCYNNYNVTVMGDMIASDDGSFSNTGTYIMANSNPGGLSNLQFNGSEVRNLVVDGEATFKALDALSISNLFTLTNGIFDGNGQEITIGNSSNVANISSLYKIGDGGSLLLGNRTTFNVLSGGAVEVIGTPGLPATVKGRTSSSYYYFNIENSGTISASNYIFQNMFDAGIYVKNGATINETHNFSNGSFLNPTSGGICLRIENTQSFINEDSIANVRFPNNPGNGTKNVAKLVSTTGVLDFYSASGELAGADYEDDNYNLINWPGISTITWKGGAYVNTGNDRLDWNIAANWEPARVPSMTDNVVIPATGITHFPIFNIDKVSGYTDTVKTLENNYLLLVDANHANDEVSLVVLEEFMNNNTIKLTGVASTLSIEGAFTNNGNMTTGTPLGGTLRFSGNNSSVINGAINEYWLSLEVDKQGIVQVSDNVYVKDVNVIAGKLQYINNNRSLTVNGAFINKGEVDMAQSKLRLIGAGAYSFEPNFSSYYNLEVAQGIYELASPQLDASCFMTIRSAGTFKLNGNVLVYGSGSTSGSLVVDGTLDMNDDSELRLRSDADVIVGGSFIANGAENQEARITNNGTGRYAFVIGGGNIDCENYIFEYLDEEGLVIEAGSTIGSLSDGKFSYGAAGGRYIDFKNDVGINDNDTLKIGNIQFDEGPLYNAKRREATNGIVSFKDAFGLTAGHNFEDDDGGGISSGAIVWTYTTPTLFWEGDVSDDWDIQQNWNPEAVPDDESIIFIQTVADGDYYPVLDSDIDPTTAVAKKLTIYAGATVTLAEGLNLDIKEDITISGSLIVEPGPISTITVGASWANNGTFTNGGSSTVEFTSEANMDINTGGQPFYNLHFNSGSGIGTAIFSTQSDLTVQGDLGIEAGTFKISNSDHKLYVAGDFTNTATFIHGGGTVILNGSSAQSVSNSLSDFYDLTLSGVGAKTLESDITIVNDFESAALFNAGAHTINIQGDLVNNGTFNAQTSNVVFNGNSSQFISKKVTLNNLVINNSTPLTAVNLGKPVNVVGSLSLLDGIVETSSSNLIVLESGASLAASGPQSYINGSLRKTGDADFTFPIGSGNKYAPLGISGMLNSGTFTASYSATGYNPTQLTSGLNHVSSVERWNLLRNSGAGEPLVTFYWNDGFYSGITDIEPLVGAYYLSGTGWTNKGKSAFTGNIDVGTITTDIPLTQFGYLTIGWEYIDLIWTGATDTDWHTAGNWSPDQEPSATTNIVIDDEGVTNFPILSSNGSTFDLNIKDGASLDIASGSILDAGGNTSVESGGVLNLIDNAELYLKGDFTNSGTLTADVGSTISINGTVEQDISDITAYNLNIAGTETKTLYGITSVGNDLTIGGALDLNNSSMSIGGSMSLTGTITSASGSVEFNGTTQQIISGNKQIGLYDVIVNNTFATAPQLVLTTNIAINNSLTLTDGIISIPDNSEEITLEVSASSTEGNSGSFVDGNIRKIGITDFVFPTGDGERWARIGISDMGSGSGDFKARYFYENYGVPMPVSGAIDHVSFTEYWDLARPSGTATPKATLYWEDTASSAIDDPALLLVAHYRGGTWRDMGNSAHSWTGVGNSPGYVTSDVNFNSFSPVTFASTSSEFNPLPVELIDFEVVSINDEEVLASWSTLSETNNSHFVLERSQDGFVFETLGTITGAGNSNVINNYNYTDKEPYVGVSYYRIRQVDFDGVETLSSVKSVFIDKGANIVDVVLFPNPVKDGSCSIEIKGQQEAQLHMVIVNSNGLLSVNEDIYIENGILDISDMVMNLPSGLYTVVLNNEKKNWTKKLFIE